MWSEWRQSGGKVRQRSWSALMVSALWMHSFVRNIWGSVWACSQLPCHRMFVSANPVGRNHTYIVGLNCFLFPSHRGCSLINCAKNSPWWRVKWATGVDFKSSFSIGYMFTGHSQRAYLSPQVWCKRGAEGEGAGLVGGGWGGGVWWGGVRGSIGQGSCVLEPAKDCASQACSVPLNGSLNS